MNPNLPQNLIAVQDGAHVMGYYVLFTVPQRPVPSSKLQRAWAASALPMNLIPESHKEVDVFKRACRSIETRRRTASKRIYEIKVDQVSETSEHCVYQITRMIRNQKQQLIDHPKAMRVIYTKPRSEPSWPQPANVMFPNYGTEQQVKTINLPGDIEFDPLTKTRREELQHLEEAILEYMDEHTESVPATKVRSAIRALFESVGGINVRRIAGGIYFIPKEGYSELRSLITALHHVYGSDAEMHLIPCANDSYQQEMVQRHYEMNVSSEIDETLSKIADKLQSERRIRQDALGNMLARRRELGEQSEQYAQMVEGDLATVTEKLSLLDKQLAQLLEHVGEKKKKPRRKRSP